MSGSKLWEEIEIDDIRVGDSLFITWVPLRGDVTIAPAYGKVAGIGLGVIRLHGYENITIDMSQAGLYPVILRKLAPFDDNLDYTG